MSKEGLMGKIERFKKEHEEQFKEWKIGFKIVWSNPLMKIGIILMLALLFIAIFAPWISPYPEDAESMGTTPSSGSGVNSTVYSCFYGKGEVFLDSSKIWDFYQEGNGSTQITVGNSTITMTINNKTVIPSSLNHNIPISVNMDITVLINKTNTTPIEVHLSDHTQDTLDIHQPCPTYLSLNGFKNATFKNTSTNLTVSWSTLISAQVKNNQLTIESSTTVTVVVISKTTIGQEGKNFWQPPSWKHPFGTDYYNRDIMTRVFFGTRIAFFVSIFVVALAILIGVPLGAIAGYYGGALDEILMRITDIFLAFPALLLAMLLSITIGPNLMNAMFALAIAWWPWYTRIMRNMVLSIRERPYVMAAKAAGISNFSIITRFILPNSISPIIVQATLDMGSVILAEAALAFLGLGAQPPTPDWGLMISTEATYITQGIWWPSVFPGIFIFITVLAFNLIGDALREFLDPKIRLKRFR